MFCRHQDMSSLVTMKTAPVAGPEPAQGLLHVAPAGQHALPHPQHDSDVVPSTHVDSHKGRLPGPLGLQGPQGLLRLLPHVVVPGELLEELVSEVAVEGPGAGVAGDAHELPRGCDGTAPPSSRSGGSSATGSCWPWGRAERGESIVHPSWDEGWPPIGLGQGARHGVLAHLVPML